MFSLFTGIEIVRSRPFLHGQSVLRWEYYNVILDDHNVMHDILRDNLSFSNQYDFTYIILSDHFKDGQNEEAERFSKYVSDSKASLSEMHNIYKIILYYRTIPLEVSKQH